MRLENNVYAIESLMEQAHDDSPRRAWKNLRCPSRSDSDTWCALEWLVSAGRDVHHTKAPRR